MGVVQDGTCFAFVIVGVAVFFNVFMAIIFAKVILKHSYLTDKFLISFVLFVKIFLVNFTGDKVKFVFIGTYSA